MRTKHRAGQFLHVPFCVPQSLFDEFGGLCFTYSPADGVFRGCIQNDLQCQTVVVSGTAVLTLLLICELCIPSIEHPHEHGCCRCFALHSVAHTVPERLCSVLAGLRDEAVVISPLLNSAPGDSLPAVSRCPLVVEVRYLLTIEVPVLADESNEHVSLFALKDLRRVLVAVPVVLVNETFQTILLILIDLGTELAMVLRKTERIVQTVKSAHILCYLFP